jgi:hypothetical protein
MALLEYGDYDVVMAGMQSVFDFAGLWGSGVRGIKGPIGPLILAGKFRTSGVYPADPRMSSESTESLKPWSIMLVCKKSRSWAVKLVHLATNPLGLLVIIFRKLPWFPAVR